jgi:uncharacterized delta-60 repeat protein
MLRSTLLFFVIAMSLTAVLAPAWCQVTQDWVVFADGWGITDDYVGDVAIDSVGNIFVTGGIWRYTLGKILTTVKYSPDGQLLWQVTYQNPYAFYDMGQAIVLDNLGNVYVTGECDDSGVGVNYDFITIKYNPDGHQQWAQRYDGPGNAWDWARAFALDSDGNVIVTGESRGPGPFPTSDWATIKYSPEGQQLWVARYNGPVGNGWDNPYALAVDHDGNIYVAGTVDMDTAYSPTQWDWAVVKYDSSGQQQWVDTRGSSYPAEAAMDVAVDDSSNVYVTGFISDGLTPLDYLTIKYNSQGVVQWQNQYDNPLHIDDYALSLALDFYGNVYVAGKTSDSPYGILTTIKYKPDGSQAWVESESGLGGSGTTPVVKLCQDQENNLYVVGEKQLWGLERDWLTVKYSDLGVRQWAKLFDGSPLDNYDQIAAMAVGPNNEVITAGRSAYNGGSNFNWATVKYSQANVLHVSLSPINPPLQIPASGGSFQFEATLSNSATTTRQFSLWVMVQLPSQNWYGPVLGPLSLTLQSSVSITRLRTQNVPASAPAGQYIYEARLGAYPDTIYTFSHFNFVKLGAASPESGMDRWSNSGEEFNVDVNTSEQIPISVNLHASPNPFNNVTNIVLNIPTTSQGELEVYNLSGQRVRELFKGTLTTGTHQFVWNGTGNGNSALPSGIYLVSWQANGTIQTIKTILVK